MQCWIWYPYTGARGIAVTPQHLAPSKQRLDLDKALELSFDVERCG